MTATHGKHREHELATFAGSVSEVERQLNHLVDAKEMHVVAVTVPGPGDENTKALMDVLVSLGPMVRRVLEQRRANVFNTLVDVLVPQQVPPATVLTEARVLGAAKEAVINSKNYVTAREIAEIAGYSGSNPNSQPNKWKREKLIFAFNHGGVDYFPAYGLDPENGWRPYPAMGTILAVFGNEKGSWSAAFWFEAANGYLGGKAPKELLVTDPARGHRGSGTGKGADCAWLVPVPYCERTVPPFRHRPAY